MIRAVFVAAVQPPPIATPVHCGGGVGRAVPPLVKARDGLRWPEMVCAWGQPCGTGHSSVGRDSQWTPTLQRNTTRAGVGEASPSIQRMAAVGMTFPPVLKNRANQLQTSKTSFLIRCSPQS